MQTHHRRQLVAVVVLSLLGIVGVGARPAMAASPPAGMFFDGEIGDPILSGATKGGQAPTWAFDVTSSDTDFQMTGYNPAACKVSGSCTDQFTVKLKPAAGGVFADDTNYDSAETYGSATVGHPGISISRQTGTACTTSLGRFDLLEYEKAATVTTKFVAQFEQHCNGIGPALFGLVSFNGGGTDWYTRTVTPEAPDFGDVRIGTTATTTINFASTDTGDDKTQPTGFVINGPNKNDFKVGPNDCNTTKDCHVDITFTPSDDGARNATLTFTDELARVGPPQPATAGTGRDVPLTGKGFHGQLSITGSGLFGDGRVGLPTESVTFRVISVGTGPVAIDNISIGGKNPSSFDGETDCPDSLAVGESCDIDVVAIPAAAGPRTATLIIDNDSTTPSLIQNLNVKGTLGYYLGEANGKVTAFGDADHFGDMSKGPLNAPILGLSTTHDGDGYWLIGGDGGIFGFGDAGFFGSMGGKPLNKPIFGMAGTPGDDGYWLVASDGGIFAFGKAPFKGSMGGTPLNKPVVGIASTPTGGGYWMVASDGGIFAFGDAKFFGSMGGTPLNQPIVGMAVTPTGKGYWLVAKDGGIFGFGDAGFFKSLAGQDLGAPIFGMVPSPTGLGYWLYGLDGQVYVFGDARWQGDLGEAGVGDVIGMAGTAPFVDPDRADGPNAAVA
jgi:hypothetical protein